MREGRYQVRDARPLASDSHRIELLDGMRTVARLSVMKVEAEEGPRWYVHSVATDEDHRGQGLARRLVAHVEENYGPICVDSANDGFWGKLGFCPAEDGRWVKAPAFLARPVGGEG